MREESQLVRCPKPNKCSDQNQTSRTSGKTGSNILKTTKSSSGWGSHIVKGFTDKKTKAKPHPNEVNPSSVGNKKVGVHRSDDKSHLLPYSTRSRRSIIGDFPLSSAQVHPHVSTQELFTELDHLRNSLKESKEREEQWRREASDCKMQNSELEKEIESQKSQVENLKQRIGSIELEKTKLSEQVVSLTDVLGKSLTGELDEDATVRTSVVTEAKRIMAFKKLELEAVELRRLNKDLQHQKRELSFRLTSTESQLASLAKIAESDLVAKVEAEASKLRHTNEDLCKQVEGLQMSRFTEVEELVYLRWVNSCLRYELRNSGNVCRHPSALDLSETMSPHSHEAAKKLMMEYSNDKHSCKRNINLEGTPSSMRGSAEFSDLKKVCLLQKFKKLSKTNDDCPISESHNVLDKDWEVNLDGGSLSRRHSISGSKDCSGRSVLNMRRQSSGSIGPIELETENCGTEKDSQSHEMTPNHLRSTNRLEINKMLHVEIEKRTTRVPNPPPKPSNLVPVEFQKDGNSQIPVPPPPPPPPPKLSIRNNTNVMQRAPQVVEFYHSLMKRDSRKDSSAGHCDVQNVANVRSSMIGEIENRSSHLLAIKADVETQGEFVRSLIREVENAVYNDIEDVVEFVKWLDDELGFLVDERAVLKHFEWPERKADALREAAFCYRDLKKLENEISKYEDDHRLPCDASLKKMLTLSEKMERGVNDILRNRESMTRHCKQFQIPTSWMLDNGLISKIKFGSVKLAKKYMKRVAVELQSLGGACEKYPTLEYILLQGVRFAFRMHQFAGGFDAETMHAFEELRNLAHIRKE